MHVFLTKSPFKCYYIHVNIYAYMYVQIFSTYSIHSLDSSFNLFYFSSHSTIQSSHTLTHWLSSNYKCMYVSNHIVCNHEINETVAIQCRDCLILHGITSCWVVHRSLLVDLKNIYSIILLETLTLAQADGFH